MELKSYQKKVLSDLSSYLNSLNRTDNLYNAWHDYWNEQGIAVGSNGVPKYHNEIPSVPHICMKVPTGGGKTFLACCSIKKIFDAFPIGKTNFIVWLVPSDAIYTQTLKALSDPNHPYRERLSRDFGGRVQIYTKESLLNGQEFSPDTVYNQLSICVLSFASVRIDKNKKDSRRLYYENGNLLNFSTFGAKELLLPDTPETALIQVLRKMEPLIIVDESHNATSDLSVEMLNNLNPSFVMDLTATPRENSNIISYVDARELKKENMVKLPVIVYQRNSRQDVIRDAIALQNKIESESRKAEVENGSYIRPIVLFQAQPQNNDDSETFDKIKTILLDIGIPEEQIAIKTSKKDDIKNVNLMSSECPIRYIITVNALKEGWDCPFAYILASVANKSSKVEVEQIVGRVLRQPYAKKQIATLLNMSYVLTCSTDFHATLENIVEGLNKAGFSKKDYRSVEIPSAEITPVTTSETENGQSLGLFGGDSTSSYNGNNSSLSGVPSEETHSETTTPSNKDDFSDIDAEKINTQISTEKNSSTNIENMQQEAENAANEFEQNMQQEESEGQLGGELSEMVKKHYVQPQFIESIRELKIPQFMKNSGADLFGDEWTLLEKNNLTEGFSLESQDANIDFELATGEMYSLDVAETGEAIPKYKRLNVAESEQLREVIASMSPKGKRNHYIGTISGLISKYDQISDQDIIRYVERVVSNMTANEYQAMETSIASYAKKIRDKIDVLLNKYREAQFKKWNDSGKLKTMPYYKFPEHFIAEKTLSSIDKSLYTEEPDDMNEFEFKVINVIASEPNILWWHRIIERKGFRINGFINHYPDFVIMTQKGHIILLEAKGDHLANEDSMAKLNLGRAWQAKAGDQYRYFMVYESKQLDSVGAYTIDGIIEVIRNL